MVYFVPFVLPQCQTHDKDKEGDKERFKEGDREGDNEGDNEGDKEGDKEEDNHKDKEGLRFIQSLSQNSSLTISLKLHTSL